MADEHIIHRGRGVVRIRIGRDGAGVSDEADGAGRPGPLRGPLSGDPGEEEYARPSRPKTVRLFDLGTRLVVGPPHTYRELPLMAPRRLFDSDAFIPGGSYQFDGTDFPGEVPAYVTAADYAAYVTAPLLADDPFGQTTINDQPVSHALLLNRTGELGRKVTLDWFRADGLPGSSFLEIPPGTEENDYWKWAAEPASAEEWAADVTEYDLAPNGGRYMRKQSPPYASFSFYVADSERYWGWLFDRPAFPLTETPDYDAPHVHPALAFPLRVFAAPALLGPVEVVASRATIQGRIGLPYAPIDFPDPTFSYQLARAIITEQNVGHVVRSRQIPRPEVPAVPPDYYPPENHWTLRRTSVWWEQIPEEREPAARVPATTWELLNRRPLAPATIQAQAVTLAGAVVAAPVAATFSDDTHVPLGWLLYSESRAGGGLLAAIEMKKKMYYVWRVR